MRRRRKVVVLGAGVAVIAAAAVVLASRPGSTAGPWDGWGCPPETGQLYLDDEIYARFGLAHLGDGTWAVGQVTNCGPPPPDDPEPGPTP